MKLVPVFENKFKALGALGFFFSLYPSMPVSLTEKTSSSNLKLFVILGKWYRFFAYILCGIFTGQVVNFLEEYRMINVCVVRIFTNL